VQSYPSKTWMQLVPSPLCQVSSARRQQSHSRHGRDGILGHDHTLMHSMCLNGLHVILVVMMTLSVVALANDMHPRFLLSPADAWILLPVDQVFALHVLLV